MSRKSTGKRPLPLSRYDNANRQKGTIQQSDEEQGKKGSIKNQIRSLKRLLNKKILTGKALEKKERELAHLEKLVVKRQHNERDRALAKKYHKIRFFERIKLTRKIKKIERAIAASASNVEQEELEKKKNELENDLVYVMHFPKGHKYISLFGEGLSEKQIQTRNELRALAIENAEKGKQKRKNIETRKSSDTMSRKKIKNMLIDSDNQERVEKPIAVADADSDADADADDFFL